MPTPSDEWIPLTECKPRRLYRLRSRNLSVGVFDGKDGFIGIRVKFGNRFLDTEYHWDKGPPHGTAKPLEDLGLDLPDPTLLANSLPTEDRETGRPVAFDRTPATVEEGGNSAGLKGWYFTDTGEYSHNIWAVSKINRELYLWLSGENKNDE